MFFTQQTFSMFIPLAVTLCSNFDPCGKTAVLTGAIEVYIKIFHVFYTADIFQFHSFGWRLGSQVESLWQKCDPDRCDQHSNKSRFMFFYPADILHFHSLGCHLGSNLDPWGKNVILADAIKNYMTVVYVFYPASIFHFHSFGCHLGSKLGSLRQKCDPDQCDQNLQKSRLCFLPSRHFPFFSLWRSLGIQSLILVSKSQVLKRLFRIQWNSVKVFLLARHFPFCCFCCPLGSHPGSWLKKMRSS